MTGALDDILGLLGLGPAPPSVSAPAPADDGEPEIRVVQSNGSSWIEVVLDDEPPFRVARPKAMRLVIVMGEVGKWASGGTPRGRRGDCEWRPVRRRGQDLLEVRIADWKPLRIGRTVAKLLVRNEKIIRDFAGI